MSLPATYEYFDKIGNSLGCLRSSAFGMGWPREGDRLKREALVAIFKLASMFERDQIDLNRDDELELIDAVAINGAKVTFDELKDFISKGGHFDKGENISWVSSGSVEDHKKESAERAEKQIETVKRIFPRLFVA